MTEQWFLRRYGVHFVESLPGMHKASGPRKLGVVTHALRLSTQDVEAGGLEVQGLCSSLRFCCCVKYHDKKKKSKLGRKGFILSIMKKVRARI